MPHLPIKLYSVDQVRALDQSAIRDAHIPGFQLMSLAGQAVFNCISHRWAEAYSFAVFCGSGNNAGDGYVIACLLLEAQKKVCVYALSDPENLKGDALTAYRHYQEMNGFVIPYRAERLVEGQVIVDALLGSGLDRPVTGLYAEAIKTINLSLASVIAVDIPSGLNGDTGSVMGVAVKADCTVVFAGLKRGLFTGQAQEYCGEICFSDLGIPKEIYNGIPASASRVAHTKLMPRNRSAHKGDFGHVLVVGGNLGFAGAARMAGEAALRVGAGLVSVATRKEHSGLLGLTRPELMCHGVANGEDLRKLVECASVLVLGPGLGQCDWGIELYITAIKFQKPMVIDADGLNLLAKSPVVKPNCVLTPHPKEAARLLNSTVEEVQKDRFAAASAIQAKYGGVVVLKGAGSLIASEKGIAISNTGNPGMASGGMGDVLSGVIAGLLAQGYSLKTAAEMGVYFHGKAADLAAEKKGERGLLASDLMPYLRRLVN